MQSVPATIEQRVATVESRQEAFSEQLQQLTVTVHTIDERTRKGELEQVKTQTLLEVVRSEISNTNLSVRKLAESQQEMFKAITEERLQRAQADSQQEMRNVSGWQKFWESKYSSGAGYIVAIFASLIAAKYFHW